MCDPNASVDPYRDASRGERVNTFLKIAWRATIGDKLHIDAASMGTDQSAGNAGTVG